MREERNKSWLPAQIMLHTPIIITIFLITSLSYIAPAFGHALTYEEVRNSAVTLTFRYSGAAGIPSNAKVLVFKPGEIESPYLSTTTDANGRVSFLPDSEGVWRIEIQTEEGHEKVVELPVNENSAGSQSSALLRILLLVSLVANILLAVTLIKIFQKSRADSKFEEAI